MRNSMNKKQEIEEHYYRKFAAAAGLPEICEIKDKPDVRIEHDQKNIGIEVTGFYLKNGSDISSEQRQVPIRDRVVADAQSLYEKKNDRAVEISLGFNIIKHESGLAKRIVDWLDTQNLITSGVIQPNIYNHISELRFASVDIGPYTDAKWRNTQVHNTPNTSAEDLQRIICEKEKLVNGYDKSLNETWLLIVIDFMNFGMDQEPANVDYSGIIVINFDKVILFKTAFNLIKEFPKQPKPS